MSKRGEKINAYQRVRNNDCIYRRVGNTNVFRWKELKRDEANILLEIHMNQKFRPIV